MIFMISAQTLQLVITSGVVGAVIGSIPTVTYFKNKGVNIDDKLAGIDKVIDAGDKILKVADSILPGNSIVNVLEVIEKSAKIAVGYAEQLCHVQEITKEERIATAQEVVYAALGKLSIAPDDNMKALVNATIENAVLALGHKDPTEAEKAATQQALQAQVTQLTTERDNLKNAITTAATAVSVSQPVQQTA
jgi:membrane-associated protease RseP (regulator of RpoE activity)